MALCRLGLQRLGAVLNMLQQQGVQTVLPCQQLAACASTSMPAMLASALPQQQYQAWVSPMCSRPLFYARSSSTTAGSSPQFSSSTSNHRPASAKESLHEIRSRIFEQHIGDGRRSGRKVILQPLKGRHIASWYFTLTNYKMPMMEDEIEQERMMKVQMARATGGGPPKKGQGKRAGKKR